MSFVTQSSPDLTLDLSVHLWAAAERMRVCRGSSLNCKQDGYVGGKVNVQITLLRKGSEVHDVKVGLSCPLFNFLKMQEFTEETTVTIIRTGCHTGPGSSGQLKGLSFCFRPKVSVSVGAEMFRQKSAFRSKYNLGRNTPFRPKLVTFGKTFSNYFGQKT